MVSYIDLQRERRERESKKSPTQLERSCIEKDSELMAKEKLTNGRNLGSIHHILDNIVLRVV